MNLTQFHKLEIGDCFIFEPNNTKWEFFPEEDNKEIDNSLPFEKQIIQFMVRLKNSKKKQSKYNGPGKWKRVYCKEKVIVYEKVAPLKYRATQLGEPNQLNYQDGKPIVFDILIPFLPVYTLNINRNNSNNDSC
jgi:hypothetical protein